MTAVSEDWKQQATRCIKDLFGSGDVEAPISAFNLLSRLLSSPSASRTSPVFRLTDLHKLEQVLEDLADSWDSGSIILLRDDEGLHVMQVRLEGADQLDTNLSRKRKRAVDEDADSAEEEAARTSPTSARKNASGSPLYGLSKEAQETYALSQRGTARHRLLTEQVR